MANEKGMGVRLHVKNETNKKEKYYFRHWL